MKFTVTVLAAIAIFSGCSSTPKKSYTAVDHDGRIYVIGKEDTLMSFKETHHLPLTKSMIGAGPNGETVVVEVCKEDPEMANKLWMNYANENIKYYERYHDGRVYVMGSLSTLENFKTTHHLPLTKTYIGEGAGGITVVIEESKEDAELSKNLWAMYKAKHKK